MADQKHDEKSPKQDEKAAPKPPPTDMAPIEVKRHKAKGDKEEGPHTGKPYTPLEIEQEIREQVPKGVLGDGGPSSDSKGKNQGNMREEKDQAPMENAVAGGPNVGLTPSAEPGMSHA